MKKLFYFCVVILLFTSCQPLKMVSIDRTTNEVALKKGQNCEIAFLTNGSMGYWWHWTNESEVTIVKSAGDRYENTAPEGMIGAPVTRYWQFESLKRGKQTLHFIYARDEKSEPIKTRDVIITVK